MKYEKLFIDFFSKQNVFDTSDARRFLSRVGASDNYTRLMLHKMVQSKKVLRIGKGIYTLQRKEAVVGYALRPFYYGLEYALTIRKIWTQQSVPVIITKTKGNPGIRELMGIKVIVHRIDPERFFGFEYLNYDGIFVPVSDPEKTLLDFTYYKIKLYPNTLTELRNRIDESKLKDYSERMFIKSESSEFIRQ